MNNSIPRLCQMLQCGCNTTEVRPCQNYFGRMYPFHFMHVFLFGPWLALWYLFPYICAFRCFRSSSKHFQMVRVSKVGVKQGGFLPHAPMCKQVFPAGAAGTARGLIDSTHAAAVATHDPLSTSEQHPSICNIRRQHVHHVTLYLLWPCRKTADYKLMTHFFQWNT